MSQEKIEIPIGLDASGISNDIQKASNNVGKATTGMAKGIAAAIGQSMGPFGELIEKADAFKNALAGVTGASRLLAIGVSAAGVAAVYGIKKAVDAYGEMKEAIDEATASTERLAKSQTMIGGPTKGGIAESEVDRKVRITNNLIAELQRANAEQVASTDESSGRVTESKLSPSQIKANLAEIERLKASITPEALKKSVSEGESRLGTEMLTKEAIRAMDEATFQKTVETIPTGDIYALREQRKQATEELANLAAMPRTQATAEQANKAAEWAANLDRLIKALEERQRTEAVPEDRPRIEMTTPAPEPPKGMSFVPTSYGVGGYTSTGGGGNIYGGARIGMESVVKDIAANVKTIAENSSQPTTGMMIP